MHINKKYKEMRLVLGSDKPRILFFPLIKVKMTTTAGILTYVSRKNFMLSCVENKKCFITSGQGLSLLRLDQRIRMKRGNLEGSFCLLAYTPHTKYA